jgi:hypothetical protein
MFSEWMWLVVAVGSLVALVPVSRWAIADFWLDRIGAPLLDWRPPGWESERTARADTPRM